MNTNPEVLSSVAALGSPVPGSLDLRMGQFFTGMVSGRICCPKPAGIQAITAINPAAHIRFEPILENLGRGHKEFIAVDSCFAFEDEGLREGKQ